MKILFKTNITALLKVQRQLRLSQTMNYTQVILHEENQIRLRKSIEFINKAIEELDKIV